MIASIDPINSGFCLTDPSDERYQFVASLRQRFGTFLHNASKSLRQQGEENTVDAVDVLVSIHINQVISYHSPFQLGQRCQDLHVRVRRQ